MSRRKTQKKPNDAGLITSGIIFIIIGLVFAFMGGKRNDRRKRKPDRYEHSVCV